MKPPQGRLWRWRRRLAARLLVPPAGPWDDDASGEAPPVLLDDPDTEIWLRATSMPEQSRYDRVGRDDAPSYGLWAR